MSWSEASLDTFALKLGSLYFLIALGWIGGRFLRLQVSSIANILIYFISPFIFFGSVASLTFSGNLLACLVLTWLPATACIWLVKVIGARYLDEPTARLVATSSGLSNGGYFGIPLYLMLFGENTLGIWMLLVVGSTFFETTVGYYQLARSHFSIAKSIRKLLLLPAFGASILALIFSWMGWDLPQSFRDLHREFRGAYLILGMMIIGVALSATKLSAGWNKSLVTALAGRILLYPALMIGVIFIEHLTIDILSPEMRRAALVFGLLPVAANAVAYASQLDLADDLAGQIVFFSTVICSVLAPIVVISFSL